MGNCAGNKSKKDAKILTDEEIRSLENNTTFTKPQILALHKNFLSECPSGKLVKKDFVKLFKEMHPTENKKQKADKFCNFVFNTIDKEKLGYISFQEFVTCFVLSSNGSFKEKCEFAFRLFDINEDDKITNKEMTKILTAMYDSSGITDRKGDAAPSKKVEAIIKSININNPLREDVLQKPEKDAKNPKGEKAAKNGKDGKSEKASKPAKPEKQKKQKAPKPPTYITKDQFISACETDPELKKVFVDSIFSADSESSDGADKTQIRKEAFDVLSATITDKALPSNEEEVVPDVKITHKTEVRGEEVDILSSTVSTSVEPKPEESNSDDPAADENQDKKDEEKKEVA